MVYDSHLHVGVLSDGIVIHPNEIKSFVSQYGVKGGLIMPTARLSGDDNLELHDMLYGEALNCGFLVALYMTFDVLKKLKEGCCNAIYTFSAFKIHPEAVDFSDKDLDDICTAIGGMKKPLLIHTGGIECAHASRFENIIRKNKQQTFVLCHGRPSEEAFMMLNKYDNVWVDTAFLSIDKIKTYISEFNEDRILFGSDYPINRWFSEHTDDEKWYNKQIKDISESFPFRVSEKILCKNYLKLFGSE